MSARQPLSAEDLDYLRESRRRSGVSQRITDPRAIEQIAGLVLSGDAARSRPADGAKKSA